MMRQTRSPNATGTVQRAGFVGSPADAGSMISSAASRLIVPPGVPLRIVSVAVGNVIWLLMESVQCLLAAVRFLNS